MADVLLSPGIERSEQASPDQNTVNPRTNVLRGLTVVTVLLVAFGLWVGIGYAGTDVDQGNVQRLFYLHMPAFFGAFLAFGAAVYGGVQYLRTRQPRWDTLALAGIEVGLALSLVNLVTGSIWARPIWNTWWTWDPRLTSAAVMVLTYMAYFMLRNSLEQPEQRRRFASVYGIFAFTTVILTLVIIRIRPDTIHPVVIAGASSENALGGFTLMATPGVALALVINLFIWTILVPVTLMWHRIRLENLHEQVQAKRARFLGGME